ncbi:MAG: hypothetical protein IKQ16_04605 [Lentisphaeria bacterium]|nr:hypothetical protein [Lentisphaeria bacterium]
MTGTKQILLAGFAALCMVLPACRSTSEPEAVETPPLVAADIPLTAVSYFADYTQDGAVPFTCEVRLGTDGRIRRDYVWKDEKDTEKKVSIVIDGKESIRIEDGKPAPANDVDTAKARFFAGLILNLDSVVSTARRKKDLQDVDGIPCCVYILELSGIPDIESCLVASAPNTNRWIHLFVPMADDSDTVFSTDFEEYKSESGVTYPSRIVSSTDGGAPVRCTIRDVRINPELPDELFRLPDING